MVTAYKPEIELFTSGIAFAAMLTVKDGTSTVDVWLEQREARELAAAIEHTADMAAAGTEHAATVAIGA